MPERISLFRSQNGARSRKITSDERVLYMHALFYLTAVAKVASLTGRCLTLEHEAMHGCYPLYARLMNAPESFAEEVGPKKYRAISIFFKEEEKIKEKEGTLYVPLILYEMNNRFGVILDALKPEDRRRTLEAARGVCKCLFDGWDWDSVDLTV